MEENSQLDSQVYHGGSFGILIDMVGQIELTDSETALYAQVSEAERLLGVDHDYQRARLAGVASRELVHSLMERHAIPEQRLRYFTDKTYNPSNTCASKRELFLRNAHTDDAMYEHPHFWKYLLYFINGADLPRPVIDQFAELAADEDAVTTMRCRSYLGKQLAVWLAIQEARLKSFTSSRWTVTAVYPKHSAFAVPSCRSNPPRTSGPAFTLSTNTLSLA